MPIDKLPRLTRADLSCIEQAITYIDAHYMDKISAEHLAIEIMMSKEKIQAGFQKKTGFTLHEYILQVRIEKAKELLIHTNHPVKAIADAAGFNNDSHFCKVFRKFMAISPVKFRFQEAG
jgi:transcriptional regulator GlxA family with amidase domain